MTTMAAAATTTTTTTQCAAATAATAASHIAFWSAISDVTKNFAATDDDGDDGDGDSAGVAAVLARLPICAPDCADGELYYRVLSAWCVPWSKVPKAQFFRAWLAIGSAATRRELVAECKAFPQELDEDRWLDTALVNDDVDTFAAVTRLSMSASSASSVKVAVLMAAVGFGDNSKEEVGAPKSNAGFRGGKQTKKRRHRRKMAVVMQCIRRGAVQCLKFWFQTFRKGIKPDVAWRSLPGHCQGKNNPFTMAAANGRLSMLKFVTETFEDRLLVLDNALSQSALHGHLDCVAYLYTEYVVRVSPTIMADAVGAAARGGHLACLQYLFHADHEHRQKCIFATALGMNVCSSAASTGSLGCLRFLHEHGCYWTWHTCVEAARAGHVACLAYACENGCLGSTEERSSPWIGAEVINVAARGGHLDCIKYMYDRGYAGEWDTCNCATAGGHLECLKFLHEQGCPWNVYATAAAAVHGHLDCLMYLHENGCPFHIHICTYAVRHPDCLAYAQNHGAAQLEYPPY